MYTLLCVLFAHDVSILCKYPYFNNSICNEIIELLKKTEFMQLKSQKKDKTTYIYIHKF